MIVWKNIKICFFYLFFSLILKAIVIHSLENHQKHLDLAKKFESVGLLNLQFRNKENNKVITSHCSGVLLDPITVITLAECLEPLATNDFILDKDTNYFAANTFKLGNDVYNNPIAISNIKNVVFYNGYKKDNPLNNAQNLALIFLEQPIYNVKPAKPYEKTLLLNNKKVVLVGFGFHGLALNPYAKNSNEHLVSNRNFDFHKRACWQKITNFNRSLLETSFAIDNEELFGMFTHGDQGGGMFIKENDEWYLLGINSHRIGTNNNKDTRDITYNTKGFSLAIPSYLGWIKNNQALQKVTSGKSIANAEWTFNPYWKKGISPHNDLENNNIYKATINTASKVIFDNFINLNKLTIDHQNAQIYIPFKLPVTLNTTEIDEHISELLKNNKKFEAVEYQRSLLIDDKNNEISRILKIQTNNLYIKNGILQVSGELWFNDCIINHGTLMGNGYLIHATSPVINKQGKVIPGDLHNIGTLTITGDYQQTKNGTLVIKTKKIKNKLQNSILKVQGQAFLDGKLEIKDENNNLSHNDKIKFLHGINNGHFSQVILPSDLNYKLLYSNDNVSIKIKDIHFKKDLIINEKTNFHRPKILSSLLINQGKLIAKDKISINKELTLQQGTLKLPKSDTGRKLIIDGNYKQSDGILELKIYKNLSELIKDNNTLHPEFIWSSDKMHITKTAYLNGHLHLKLDKEALIKENTQLTLITAQKIEGQFASVTKFKGSIQPQLIYENNQVSVMFKNTHKLSQKNYNSHEALVIASVLDKEREENPKAFATLFLVLNNLAEEEVEKYLIENVSKTTAIKRLLNKFNFNENEVDK